MGSGSYIGGHTKIFISDRGTTWEVSDRATNRSDDSSRERWDDEVGVGVGRGLRKVSKEGRSFLSMCAVAFRNDVLSESHPKPPARRQREVNLAGGNRKWIASDRGRFGIFEQFYKKRQQE
jgi:hypothetical protein